MKKVKTLCALLIAASIAGCSVSPFSPRSQQRINNSGGIEEIRSNQNGLMAEFMKIKQDLSLLNSQLKDVQNGLINMSNSFSRNENSGIQILQGDGSIILVFSLFAIGGMLWYRTRAIKSEKNLSILAQQVTAYNIAELNDSIIKCAIEKGQGKEMLKILNKAIES